MTRGWIKLHRDLLQWQWYDDSLMVHLYVHLLLNANFEERKWRGITIGRGQLATSTASLARELKTTERKIYTRLQILESEGMIVKQSYNRCTVITLKNSDVYPASDGEKSEGNVKQKEDQCKHYKNVRNKEYYKKGNSPLTPQGGKEHPYLKSEGIPSDLESDGTPSDFIDETPPAPFPPMAPTPLSPAFEKWIEYKREKRQSYRSEAALRACYNRLEKYSKGDPKVAMEIIEHSIAMNYSGFFEPTQKNTTYDNRPECITNAAKSEGGTWYSTI